MKFKSLVSAVFLSLFLMLSSCAISQVSNTKKSTDIKNHPNLILTQKGVQEIRNNLGKYPLFDKTLLQTKKQVDSEMLKGILVPVPKDLAGGYTHQQHKTNYLILYKAGLLYQITQNEVYAKFVKDMLLEYAKMYPGLPTHPKSKSYAPGKLFWQNLNDANWLVYASQGYDCIYTYLTAKERIYIEKNLFVPFANHLSVDSPQFFNRIHNHSTWGNVAVGMIGLVMNNDTLIQRSLYGLKDDAFLYGVKDNDGGFIKVEGQKAGYIANLDDPFSPDGYYTEGPYYQRYAMYPFLIFATALENNKPDLKVFEYKNIVLLKAVTTLLNLTNSKGEFFALNDGQKGMSIFSKELVTATNTAYYYGNHNPELLEIAKMQDEVMLNQIGLLVAKDISLNKQKPFTKSSLELGDGNDGTKGGIGIVRTKTSTDNEMSLVFKYTSQGLSHGHYDKLSYSLYDNEQEIVQDYGLVRFVNVEQKKGGGYLPENSTWAKQTIAHNTLVKNEQSHFQGNYEIGSKNHSFKYLFDVSNPNFSILSAKDTSAYSNSLLHRTFLVLKNEKTYTVIDIFRVESDKPAQYDLPLHYLGQFIETSLNYSVPGNLKPLGDNFGYQHIWTEATATATNNPNHFTWLLNNKFISATFNTKENDAFIFGRLGANDPNFNLRRDPILIWRKNNETNPLFVTTVEVHGSYSPVSEAAVNAYSTIEKIETISNTTDYTGIKIHFKNKKQLVFILANKSDAMQKNTITIENQTYNWIGKYYLK